MIYFLLNFLICRNIFWNLMDSTYHMMLETLSVLSTINTSSSESYNSKNQANSIKESEYCDFFPGLSKFCDISPLEKTKTQISITVESAKDFTVFEPDEVYSPRLFKSLFHLILREHHFADPCTTPSYYDIRMDKAQNHLSIIKNIDTVDINEVDKNANKLLFLFVNNILPAKPLIDWGQVLFIYKMDCQEKCNLVKEDLQFQTNKLLLEWYSKNNYIITSFVRGVNTQVEITKPIFLVGNLLNLPKWFFVHFQLNSKKGIDKNGGSINIHERNKIEFLFKSSVWDDWRFISERLETKDLYIIKRCYKRKIENGKGSGFEATLNDMLHMYIAKRCKPAIDFQTLSEQYLINFNCLELRSMSVNPNYKKLENQLNRILGI